VGRKKPGRKAELPSKRRIAWPRWTGFRGMTVRDWLQLLIVPFALVVIGFLFTMQQEARQQQIENQRADAELDLADQRAQDEALQAYLDQMSTLLLEKNLRNSEEDSEVRTLARARTATVIQRLDADGNQNVIRFLDEAGLAMGGQSSPGLLAGVDLQGADLEGADLYTADLYAADLSEAKLNRTILMGADLSYADLSDAFLRDANLMGADLSYADLSYAQGITKNQLEKQAVLLEGATMPDGSKHP
jgi:uncharacterized protein YjbI with pentapeptide repeats